MAYCTIDDLKKIVTEETLIQLTDTTGAGVIDTVTAERAIREAEGLIDAYAGQRFQTPLAPVPRVIGDLAASIAVFFLHRYRSLEEAVWTASFNNALLLLARIAIGEIALDGASPLPPSRETATFEAKERRFSRDLLKGM